MEKPQLNSTQRKDLEKVAKKLKEAFVSINEARTIMISSFVNGLMAERKDFLDLDTSIAEIQHKLDRIKNDAAKMLK